MTLKSSEVVMVFEGFVHSAKAYLNTYPRRYENDIDIVDDLYNDTISLRNRTILSMSNNADIVKICELCDELINAINQWRNGIW